MKLRDFVRVEFARAWQEERGAALVDPDVAAALRADPAFQSLEDEERLVAYAERLLEERLADAADGRVAVDGIRAGLDLTGLLVPILGLFAGAAAVRAALPPPDLRPAGVVQFLAAGVLVPTAFLLLTSLSALAGPAATVRMHWITPVLRWTRGRALRTAAGRLAGRVLQRSGVAVPLLSGLSHRFWIAALVGFLGLSLARFAGADYLFSWSSTLPDMRAWIDAGTDVLAAPLPGVPPPTAEVLDVSEYSSLERAWAESTGDPLRDDALRKAWWRLLWFGTLVWGLLPRVLAAGLSAVLVRRGIRRALRTPGNQAILAALRPRLGDRQEGEDGAMPLPVPRPSDPATEPTAPPDTGLLLVLFAVPRPDEALLARTDLKRLGLGGGDLEVPADDDRAAMAEVLARLGRPETAPGGAVVVFDVRSGPDRTRERFLRDVAAALPDGAPAHVLLTRLPEFRRGPRGSRLGQRLDGWRTMAERAGVSAARVHSEPSP